MIMIGLQEVKAQRRGKLAQLLKGALNTIPGGVVGVMVDESGKLAGQNSLIATMKAYIIYDDAKPAPRNVVFTEVSSQTRNKLANKIQDVLQQIGADKFICVYSDEGGKLGGGGFLALGKGYIFYEA